MAAATPTDGSVGANDIGAIAMSLDRRMHTEAVGDIAHGSTDIGFPVKIGGRARKEDSAAVGAEDRVDAYFDASGRFVVTRSPVEELLDGTANTTGGTNIQVIAAQGSGFRGQG